MKFNIPLQISNFNKTEFIQLMSNTVDTIKASRLENIDLIRQMTEQVEADLVTLKSLHIQTRQQEVTNVFQEKLKIRKEDYSTLKTGIRFYKNSRDPQKKEAYTRLKTVLKPYKSVAIESVQEANALFGSLLKSLSSDECQADLQLLNLMESLHHLQESHQEVMALNLQRFQNASSQLLVNTGPIRKTIYKNYQNLYNYLVTIVSFDPSRPEKELLHSLNEIRQDFTMNRKKSKPAKNSEESTPNEISLSPDFTDPLEHN